MTDRRGVRRGQTVYGSDGVRWGRVLHQHDSGFVVERGVLFTEDYPVFYDEVLSVDGAEVRLRIPSSALLREEDAEAWSAPRDPVGSAGGTDLEPLRAGMAEIEEMQERLLAMRPEGSALGAPPYEGWAARARFARVWSAGEPANAPSDDLWERASEASAAPPGDRISEELEDWERGAACGRPEALSERAAAVAAARLRRRLAAAHRRRAASARAGPVSPRGRVRAPAGVGLGGGRIDYARSAPDALSPLRALETYVRRSGLEPPLLELVRLLVSRLNGCEPCVELHGSLARQRGVDAERLDALEAWPSSPLFTDRERAALAWSEAVTRIPAARVDERVYRRAREEFGERGLVDLTMAIVAINAWNRLAIAFEVGIGTYRGALI